MGIKWIPSPEILHQRMDGIVRSMRSTLLWENANPLVKNHISPSKIPCGFVPVDMDVTPCDNSKTKKEGVSRTYKGCDGYAPMMAYIGREGYLINCELRKGSQHCQKPWAGQKQYMVENVPESLSVVQLSIAHYAVYSYNDIIYHDRVFYRWCGT